MTREYPVPLKHTDRIARERFGGGIGSMFIRRPNNFFCALPYGNGQKH